MFTNEGLTDLGIAERIDVDGVGAIEKLCDGKFVTTYWCWAPDHAGVWVKAPRFHLVRPIGSLRPGGILSAWLARTPAGGSEAVLHS